MNKINWKERNRNVALETLKITEQGFYEKDGKKINLVGENFADVIVISPTKSEELVKEISNSSQLPANLFAGS